MTSRQRARRRSRRNDHYLDLDGPWRHYRVGLTPVAQYFLTSKDARVSPLQLGLATGILFGLLAWRVPIWPELLSYSVFAAFCIVTSVVDITEHRLPRRLVLPAYPVFVELTGIAAVLHGDL